MLMLHSQNLFAKKAVGVVKIKLCPEYLFNLPMTTYRELTSSLFSQLSQIKTTFPGLQLCVGHIQLSLSMRILLTEHIIMGKANESGLVVMVS